MSEQNQENTNQEEASEKNNQEATSENTNQEATAEGLKKLLEQLDQKDITDEKIKELLEQAQQFKDLEGYTAFTNFAEAKKGNKELTYDDFTKQNNAQENTSQETRQTVSINGGNAASWIEEKRKFWQEFAKTQKLALQNIPDEDAANKTFTGILLKDNQEIGKIEYQSPSAATISKDSSFVLYQGLVKDAIANNLSVTFGKTLDEKQQAMLLAACLQNQDKYKNGEKLEIKNPPKIDINADYFKELPNDVQDTLIAHVKIQELNDKVAQHKAANRDKGKKGKPLTLDDDIRKLNDEINANTVSSGKRRDGSLKSEQALKAEENAFKNNKINKDKNPLLYAAMQHKYGNQH